MADITLPRANQGLICLKDGPQGNAGTATREFYNFLRQLATLTGSAELQAEIDAILVRLDALEEGGSFTIQGPLSVAVTGQPSSGLVMLALRNDLAAPSPSFYYGTNASGVRGWYKRDLATLADVDTTTPFSAGDAPVFDGALFQPTAVLANPMTTLGDIITGDTGGVPQRLPAGADGEVLTVVAGEPAWVAGGSGGGEGGIGVSIGTYSTSATVIPVFTEATDVANNGYDLTGEWYLWCYPSGSIEIDVWKDVFGTIPTVADSICGGAEPAIVGGTFATGTFTGPISVARTDTLIAHVNSNSNVKWFKLLLVGDRV